MTPLTTIKLLLSGLPVQGSYTEEELILALKQRNEQVFSYLYDHYSGALYTIILQILQDSELSNDVLQEVFMNIWRKFDSYDSTKGRLFTWMLNISRNAAIDTLRSRSYQNSQKNQALPENVHTEMTASVVQLNVDSIGLKKTLEKLKPEQRILIEYAYYKGHTHEEIAKMAGIPLGTVKTRIRAALIDLREYFL